MADIKEKMEDIIRQEGGEIRETSAADSGQRTESLRDAAENAKSDVPTGGREPEREREREGESVEAERSGDIEAPMTDEERRRAVREKQNRNLRTTAQMTEKERREFARIGGQASAKARRKKKDLQELLGALLSSPATPAIKVKAAKLGIDPEVADTLYDGLGIAMIEKALSGDGYCFQLVRDSAGDKPTDKSEVTASVMTDKDLEIMRNLEARIKAEKSVPDGQTRE